MNQNNIFFNKAGGEKQCREAAGVCRYGMFVNGVMSMLRKKSYRFVCFSLFFSVF